MGFFVVVVVVVVVFCHIKLLVTFALMYAEEV